MTNIDQHNSSPETITPTTIVLGGETYACGLTWGHQGPGKPSLAYLIETSRSLNASSYVRYKDQIGYVPEHLNASGRNPLNGMIPAAAMIVDHFKEKSGTLLVLLAGEHPSGESLTSEHSSSVHSLSEHSPSKDAPSVQRGYLLVQARDGVLLPDGDTFFSDRETALAAFKKEMGTDWDNIFISDTVLDGSDKGPEGVKVFPTREIAGHLAKTRIKPVPFNAIRPDNYKLWGGLSAGVLVILAGLYLANEVIIPALNPIPEPVKVTSRPLLTPSVSFVDPTALLEACFTGMQNPPTKLYGWNLSKITCSPSGSKIGGTGNAAQSNKPAHGREPSLGREPTFGRGPTLTYEWTLGAGRNKAFWRRVAEKLLAKWQIGVVLDNTAFSLIPLTAAETTLEMQDLPQKADFRKQVDEVFGSIATNLQHSETGNLWTVKFSTPLSLHQLARRTAQIPGFQITSVTKAGNNTKQQSWSVEANLAQISAIPGQGGFPQGSIAPVSIDPTGLATAKETPNPKGQVAPTGQVAFGGQVAIGGNKQ